VWWQSVTVQKKYIFQYDISDPNTGEWMDKRMDGHCERLDGVQANESGLRLG